MPDRPTIQLAPLDAHEIRIPPGYRVVVNLIPIDAGETNGHAETANDRVADTIIATLAESKRRLTTMKLLSALATRGVEYSDRTVKGRLAAMVRVGRLTNDETTDPPGYGLPEWE